MVGILGPVLVALEAVSSLMGPVETPREAAARITALNRAEKWAEAKQAAEALVHASNKYHAAAVLGLLLRDQTLPGRGHIITAIAGARFVVAVPHLVDLLDDPDAGIRHGAVSALGDIGDTSAIRFLERQLRTAGQDEHYAVRVALARLGRPYLGYFIEGLRDRAPGRRYGSALALMQLKDPRAVPHLLARLAEPSDDSTMIVRWALRDTTGVPEATVLNTTRNPDGSTSSEIRIRPVGEFRKEIEVWVARNRAAVTRVIEPPAERWVFTPEPELPGLGVSFRMNVADVRRAFDKAGIKYTYHPERVEQQPGGSEVFHPERIDASGQEGFGGAWGWSYLFAAGRVEEVHFWAAGRDQGLSELVKPLGLKRDGVHGWTGLNGAIRIQELVGDAEKTRYTIHLNYRNR